MMNVFSIYLQRLKNWTMKLYMLADRIVYVLNSCPDLIQQIQSIEDENVKLFLKTEFSALIERMNIREVIESFLTEDDRTEYVLSQMEEISKL